MRFSDCYHKKKVINKAFLWTQYEEIRKKKKKLFVTHLLLLVLKILICNYLVLTKYIKKKNILKVNKQQVDNSDYAL